MLSDADLDRHFLNLGIPRSGRDLVREARIHSPVRDVQQSMNTVRVRFMSRKMNRALFAESRTVEFPGILYREFDDDTLELWPQPCMLDLQIETPNGKRTRVQHTPDLLLIRNDEIVLEEWRDEKRLERLAREYPHRYYKDTDGRWHDVYVERYVEPMRIRYHLRSADEHPRIWLSNLEMLADFTLETSRPVPFEESRRLIKLMQEEKCIRHQDLVYQHGFDGGHVMQMVLLKDVYVNLHETRLSERDELVIYANEFIARADSILKEPGSFEAPSCTVEIESGLKFLYDGQEYVVVLVGPTEVQARTPNDKLVTLKLTEMRQLVKDLHVTPVHTQMAAPEVDTAAILNSKRLPGALKRLAALQNPKKSTLGERQIRNIKEKTRGLKTHQQLLLALMSKNPGNRHSRIPPRQMEFLQQAVASFHNQPSAPSRSATYSVYVDIAVAAGTKPMSRSSYYELLDRQENTEARHGKKQAYQDEALPMYADFGHPVNGVLPHEVVYMDHTPIPLRLRGKKFADLGKPTLTLATDGAVACPRAFYLSFKSARTLSVLMCLRDYVRRHGCLPRVLVTDNGKEFHSRQLEMFADLFGFTIRWRRASKARDSARVERALGVTQQELTDNLKGNSKALQNPRNVSSTHHPEKHIEWTLRALHRSMDFFLFTTLSGRINSALGMSCKEYEQVLNREFGDRAPHRAIAYDGLFKLLSSPYPKYAAPRKVDRRRGVFVDGSWYWHPDFAEAKTREVAEARIEPTNGQVAYVCFRGQWLIAKARDGGALYGRHAEELECQRKEEQKRSQAAAQRDKASARHSRQRVMSWNPLLWDEFLREQCAEEYRTYEDIDMVEALADAKNPAAMDLKLGLPKQSLDVMPPPEPARAKRGAASKAELLVEVAEPDLGDDDELEEEFDEEVF